tara:strand:- start:220 stop:1242 length:1023 start_codon:yes stop_codon:yes gene_type:complete
MGVDNYLASLGVEQIEGKTSIKRILEINASCGVDSGDGITDFSRLEWYRGRFLFAAPSSESQTVSILERCKKVQQEYRIRGAAHSSNGNSIPKENELLISTEGLVEVRYKDINSLSVEAGVQIFELNQALSRLGRSVPVLHDGDLPASTIGGFICAGGFGSKSNIYGGFWNHVLSIRVWCPINGIIEYTRECERFWHIFGGGSIDEVILSAHLVIHGSSSLPERMYIKRRNVIHERAIWFTIIAPHTSVRRLRREILLLDKQMNKFWDPLPVYEYLIKDIGGRIPPAFFPLSGIDLLAAGVWGLVKDESLIDRHSMLDLVNQAVENVPNGRRYSQSELIK